MKRLIHNLNSLCKQIPKKATPIPPLFYGHKIKPNNELLQFFVVPLKPYLSLITPKSKGEKNTLYLKEETMLSMPSGTGRNDKFT